MAARPSGVDLGTLVGGLLLGLLLGVLAGLVRSPRAVAAGARR